MLEENLILQNQNNESENIFETKLFLETQLQEIRNLEIYLAYTNKVLKIMLICFLLFFSYSAFCCIDNWINMNSKNLVVKKQRFKEFRIDMRTIWIIYNSNYSNIYNEMQNKQIFKKN